MSPFDAYCKYLSLKLHFSSPKYDFFKYNGKTGAKSLSFDTRADKYQFYKLSKLDDLDLYLVANLMEAPNVWVGELFSDKAQTRYSELQKRHQSLSYIIESELNKVDDLKQSILCVDGKHPDLLKLYKQGIVSPETIVLLDREVGCFSYWDKKIQETYLWPAIKLKLQKYAPFVKFDQQKVRKIIRSNINSCGS